MSDRLVWLPFDPADLGELPDDLRFGRYDGREVPEGIEDVRFFVPPYALGRGVGALIPRMTSLEVVQTQTAGVDNLRGVVPDGVLLCNGRGIHDASTAELALTLTLASLRGIPDFVRAQDEGRWVHRFRPALADRRVLIVGYGQIGAAIEARLLPFEVTVDRVARSARDGVHGMADLRDLLPEADVVILVVPGTEETRHLVDAEFLAAMREGALLVNVARGSVVDQDALLAALRIGRVSAALDVTDPEPLPGGHPLWSAPNLLLTPHVGGASTAMDPRMRRIVGDQLRRWAAGEPLHNVITGDY